tara:strand:+ start:406 stop:702 length:297 start_codon:yes stop_codon:yes gene_type:complete
MVVDDKISEILTQLEEHEARIHALESQGDLIADLLTEIRDDVRAQRTRLDRLLDACTQSIVLITGALVRACDAVGHRVIVAFLLGISALLSALMGIEL